MNIGTRLFGKLRTSIAGMAITAASCSFLAPLANADAVRTDAGFTSNILTRNDDGSTGSVSLPFTFNFFGVNENHLFVNNNGNVTFDSALGTFTPFPLLTTATKIIAPFFADVDTRNLASDQVKYGTSTVNGHAAFGVNWDGLGVGYYANHADKLNSFQLVLIDRSDTGAGNVDIEFNYRQIQWETGDASGGSNGLGGSSARVGYSNGVDASFELAGSAHPGSFLDSNSTTGLIHTSNVGLDGRFVFEAREGTVAEAPAAPLPPVVIMGLVLLAGFGGSRYLAERKFI